MAAISDNGTVVHSVFIEDEGLPLAFLMGNEE